MVVPVLVAGQGVVDAAADHLQEGVLREVRVAGAVRGLGEGRGRADLLLVELAEKQERCVAGEQTGRWFDDTP